MAAERSGKFGKCCVPLLRNEDVGVYEDFVTATGYATGEGLTSVTVRRYLSYLTDAGIVTAQMDYAAGGRPCMQYRING